MTQEKNPIKSNLEQIFSELKPEIEVPEDLKEEVFQTVEEEKLIVQITTSSDKKKQVLSTDKK